MEEAVQKTFGGALDQSSSTSRGKKGKSLSFQPGVCVHCLTVIHILVEKASIITSSRAVEVRLVVCSFPPGVAFAKGHSFEGKESPGDVFHTKIKISGLG